MTRMPLELLEKIGAFDNPPPPRQQLSAMVEHWPKKLPNAEAVCTEAIRVFERELMFRPHAFKEGFFAQIAEFRAAQPQIKRAIADLVTVVSDLPPLAQASLAEHIGQSQVNFDEFLRGLRALDEFAETQLPKRKQGRTKTDATQAALAAAGVLMRNGIRRKRAARILAALMAVYPDVEGKTEEVLEQTIRNGKG